MSPFWPFFEFFSVETLEFFVIPPLKKILSTKLPRRKQKADDCYFEFPWPISLIFDTKVWMIKFLSKMFWIEKKKKLGTTIKSILDRSSLQCHSRIIEKKYSDLYTFKHWKVKNLILPPKKIFQRWKLVKSPWKWSILRQILINDARGWS